MSSNTSNSSSVSNSPNSPNLPKSSDQEQFRSLSHRHRCFRCRRFYGKCGCARKMYHHYRRGCMCRMILKGILVVIAVYIISRLMQSSDSNNMFKFN